MSESQATSDIKIKALAIYVYLYSCKEDKQGKTMDDIVNGLAKSGIPCDKKILDGEIIELNRYFYKLKKEGVENFNKDSNNNVIIKKRGAHNLFRYCFNEKSPYVPFNSKTQISGDESGLNVGELRFLYDATLSADFMTEDMVNKLCQKITDMVPDESGDYFKKHFDFKYGTRYHNNVNVLKWADIISGVIEENRKTLYGERDEYEDKILTELSLKYGNLSIKGELGEKYVHNIFPVALVFNNGYYYVVTLHSDATELRPHRLDRIIDIETHAKSLKDQTAVQQSKIKEYYERDMQKRLTNVSMWIGKGEQIKLRFREHLIGDIYDRYGNKIKIKNEGKGWCSVEVSDTNVDAFFKWIFQFGGDIQIVRSSNGNSDAFIKRYKELIYKANISHPLEVNMNKSSYCTYLTCPKQMWLQKYMPYEEKISADAQGRAEQGTQVGKIVRGYFGGYELAEIITDGKPDTIAMVDRTQELMAAGAQVICEAAFSYNGNYCAVDLLHKEGDGWAIYEVKSAVEYDKIYSDDAAYQLWVLTNCGVRVTGVKLLQINGDYIRQGALDLKQLFKETDIFTDALGKFGQIGENVIKAQNYLLQKSEPSTEFKACCTECGFFDHCRSEKNIPDQSVFDLRGVNSKFKYINRGIITFSDFAADKKQLSYGLSIQLIHDTPAKGTFVDKNAISTFLAKLSYPLYFLDFESFQSAVPLFDNCKPWQQIPSQYSLHWIESEADALKLVRSLDSGGHPLLHHSEFLGTTDDPRRELAEQLCKDIPENVCITAYNKTFECGVLGKLAEIFPDLSNHLLKIKAHIVDIDEPFKNFYYYNSAMKGRYSIKYVLPAIYPSLNYSNLNGVHNGSEAMNLYPQLKDMPPAQQQQARQDLLKYCELDTFAMVKLWQELIRVS